MFAPVYAFAHDDRRVRRRSWRSQPHWFSNLLGGWYFMGAWLAALMLDALLMLYARKAAGLGEFISDKQRHDLGKLCFGFTVFWTYLMWAQFLVIWYGNMPEETGFVFARLWGPWRPIGVAVGIGRLPDPVRRAARRGAEEGAVHARASSRRSRSCALWLERYLLVTPSVTLEAGPVFGLPELGPMLLFVRTLPVLLRHLRPDLPDGLAAAGADHAGEGRTPLASRRRDSARATRSGVTGVMCGSLPGRIRWSSARVGRSILPQRPGPATGMREFRRGGRG